VYAVSLDQVQDRFGQFQGSDRRSRLFAKLIEYLDVARSSGLVVHVIVDGSFVTAKPAPSDVDLVAVVKSTHDFSAELGPDAYNALSKKRGRKMFGFDVFVAPEESDTLDYWIGFFSQAKGSLGRQKGILQVTL